MEIQEKLNLKELFDKFKIEKGEKFYSSVCGDIIYNGYDTSTNNDNEVYLKFYPLGNEDNEIYYKLNGCLFRFPNGPISLFPSEKQQDWDIWIDVNNEKLNSIQVSDYVITELISKYLDGTSEYREKVWKVRNIHGNTAELLSCCCDFEIDDEKTDNVKQINVFKPKYFEPFDNVLVRKNEHDFWSTAIYSHYEEKINRYLANSYVWEQCIPYNLETRKLVGTTNDCPDFYKYWEQEEEINIFNVKDIDLEVIFQEANVQIGEKFYTTNRGVVEYEGIERFLGTTLLQFKTKNGGSVAYTSDGHDYKELYAITPGHYYQEMKLFPNREERNWFKWLAERKNIL